MHTAAPLIAVVAGETSGDLLGAGLIREIRKQIPDARFCGVGGRKMEAESCEILYDMERIGVMGLDGLMEKLFDILRIRKDLYRRFSDQQPDVFVGIDVPDFNLPLELKLKNQGIKCVHYVSPTVWAWRGYRIHKIKRSIHHMMTLFPFEADYYRQHGVPVTFVGHPMADEIQPRDKLEMRHEMGIEGNTVIALLPGSRSSEVKRLTRLLMDSGRGILRQIPDSQFVIPMASEKTRWVFDEHCGDIDDLPIKIVDGQAREVMQASDMAIIASGTAALEAALARCPHVVIYRLSRFSEWLAKKLSHVKHYSMSNHLLPAPVIPEFVSRHDAIPENIVQASLEMLNDEDKRRTLVSQFEDIHLKLQKNASFTAAQTVIKAMSAT